MHNEVIYIGDSVREMREVKGMTQTALADAVNVSVRTIIDIEKNKRNPTFETLYLLVRTLEIPSDVIFGRRNNALSLYVERLISEVQTLDDNEAEIVYKTVHALLIAMRKVLQ